MSNDESENRYHTHRRPHDPRRGSSDSSSPFMVSPSRPPADPQTRTAIDNHDLDQASTTLSPLLPPSLAPASLRSLSYNSARTDTVSTTSTNQRAPIFRGESASQSSDLVDERITPRRQENRARGGIPRTATTSTPRLSTTENHIEQPSVGRRGFPSFNTFEPSVPEPASPLRPPIGIAALNDLLVATRQPIRLRRHVANSAAPHTSSRGQVLSRGYATVEFNEAAAVQTGNRNLYTQIPTEQRRGSLQSRQLVLESERSTLISLQQRMNMEFPDRASPRRNAISGNTEDLSQVQSAYNRTHSHVSDITNEDTARSPTQPMLPSLHALRPLTWNIRDRNPTQVQRNIRVVQEELNDVRRELLRTSEAPRERSLLGLSDTDALRDVRRRSMQIHRSSRPTPGEARTSTVTPSLSVSPPSLSSDVASSPPFLLPPFLLPPFQSAEDIDSSASTGRRTSPPRAPVANMGGTDPFRLLLQSIQGSSRQLAAEAIDRMLEHPLAPPRRRERFTTMRPTDDSSTFVPETPPSDDDAAVKSTTGTQTHKGCGNHKVKLDFPDECGICQEPLRTGDLWLFPTGCLHGFCAACLHKWLEQSNACPMCRGSMSRLYQAASPRTAPGANNDGERKCEECEQRGRDEGGWGRR